MHGGTYVCNKNKNHRLAHFGSEPTGRLACTACSGWMMLEAQPEPAPYNKPNIIWLVIAHAIWFFLRPICAWLDKHDRSDEDD